MSNDPDNVWRDGEEDRAAYDARVDGLPIETHHIFPPIPMRDFDWCAYRDPEPGNLQGFGATEEAAIADLLEQEES